jgi:endoglucanase
VSDSATFSPAPRSGVDEKSRPLRAPPKARSGVFEISLHPLYNTLKRSFMKKKAFIFFVSVLLTTLLISCNSEGSKPQVSPEPPILPELPTLPDNPKSFNDISATDLVANIKLGWNLGNTLDANPNETSWGNPKTSKSNIDTLKAAGFNAIRIPVSWSHHIDKKSYLIEAAFMNRVKEVVGYAIANDMYILLNTHHDEEIFKFQNKDMVNSKAAFERIWQQIAENFKDENEKLIFEGLNEPRTIGSSKEWQGGTKEEWDNINTLEQIFVDVVRASGSNNVKRILMVSPYAASAEQAALNGVKIPNDPSNPTIKKFIVSVHAYAPYNFALNQGTGSVAAWSKSNSGDTSGVKTPLDRAYNTFVSKGIPVIFGDFGALDKNNESARAEWAEY